MNINKIEQYRYLNAKRYLKNMLYDKKIYWKDIGEKKIGKYLFLLIDSQFLFPKSWFYFGNNDEYFFKTKCNIDINNIEIYTKIN